MQKQNTFSHYPIAYMDMLDIFISWTYKHVQFFCFLIQILLLFYWTLSIWFRGVPFQWAKIYTLHKDTHFWGVKLIIYLLQWSWIYKQLVHFCFGSHIRLSWKKNDGRMLHHQPVCRVPPINVSRSVNNIQFNF